MGQGLLFSRGDRYSIDWSVMPGFTGWEHKYEEITSNKDWIVPRAKDNTFNVIVFGGGGGWCVFTRFRHPILSEAIPGLIWGGGGGGYMCNATLKLQFGNEVRISIGSAGANNTNGGTTSFGQYLSALGGECAKGVNIRSVSGNIVVDGIQGGNGGTGGGSVFIITNTGIVTSSIPGGSGQYGGGGGGYIGGKSGIYGGNGGSLTVDAQDGTNTIPINTIYNGNGNSGNGYYYYYDDDVSYSANKKLCGGGGYGGNGGAGGVALVSTRDGIMTNIYVCGGGGGWGDWQACGGDGRVYVAAMEGTTKSGGGGGYKGYAYGAMKPFPDFGSEPGWVDGSYYRPELSVGKGICVIDYITPVFN